MQLWPGAVHWPDFKNPATLDWWSQQLRGVNDTLPIDGIWLDMNEVSVVALGFCEVVFSTRSPLHGLHLLPLWQSCTQRLHFLTKVCILQRYPTSARAMYAKTQVCCLYYRLYCRYITGFAAQASVSAT